MNIAVFSTHILWQSHFETELEIIQNEIASNNIVYHFTCDNSFNCCEQILEKKLSLNGEYDDLKDSNCKMCVLKRKKGINLISGNVKNIQLHKSEYISKNFVLDDYYFENHSNFKKLFLENYDIGVSIVSSLISFTRNVNVDLKQYKNYLNNLYIDCFNVFYNVKKAIVEYNIDYGYVFNGRLSYTKAILKAFISLSSNCFVHDRGSSISKYSIFRNTTIHDISYITNQINATWESEKNHERRLHNANQFFINRRKGIIGSWKSFTEHQISGSLPDSWDSTKKNIVLFTSSEDEIASIGEIWNNPIYENQLSGILSIIDSFKNLNLQNFNLYIRFHPNTSKEFYDDVLSKIDNSFSCFIVPPDSNISSYNLMDNADKVISFGSTIGIEAFYWGKVSIILGKSLYYNLKIGIKPITHDEVLNVILLDHEISDDIEDSLKYGFYFQTFGIEYKYYKPVNYLNGEFKGYNLNKIDNKSKFEKFLKIFK